MMINQWNPFFFFFFVCARARLGPTTNNHDATELQEVVPEANDEGDGEAGGGEDNESGFKVKQRSILQAKLTKLAIQIGYAGQFSFASVLNKQNTSSSPFSRHDHRHLNRARSLNSIFHRNIRSRVNNWQSRNVPFVHLCVLDVRVGVTVIGVYLCDI